MSRALVLLGFCLMAVLSGLAQAHESRPALLQLIEVGDNRFDVLWKRPVMGELALRLTPQLSGGQLGITPTAVSVSRRAETSVWRSVDADLERETLRIEGLEHSITDVLVSVNFRDGDTLKTILRPQSPAYRFSGHQPLASVVAYLSLGISHILTGPDHLLFVLVLLLLLRDTVTLVKSITAFTVAHSITLALVTLEIVTLNVMLIESLVALSIAIAAVEVVNHQRGQPGVMVEFPWVIAFVFGLLHGSAFGGELVEVGLPREDVAPALLLFNLGIEIGQLLFIAAVLLAYYLVRHWIRRVPPALKLMPAYAIGSLGALWFFQRIDGAFPVITTLQGSL